MRWLGLLCLVMTSCVPAPQWYPVPYQRVLLRGEDPSSLGEYVSFTRRSAQEYVVADILDGDSQSMWRWTNQNPTLRFRIEETKDVDFELHFAVSDVTAKKTGPVTMRVLVNEHLLAVAEKLGAGKYKKSWPVPPEILKVNEDTLVRLELDKVFLSDQDRVKLGVILEAAGFRKP